MNAKPAHVISLVVDLFDDMGYYNVVSSFFDQVDGIRKRLNLKKIGRSELCWKPPPEEWIKINMDASRRIGSKSTSIGYITRLNCSNDIMARCKRIGDCPIW